MGSNRLIAAGLSIILLSVFIAFTPYLPQYGTTQTGQPSYQLDMVIAPRESGNITDYAFYVVVNGMYESSAAINVPANVSIQITIHNQDNGTDSLMKESGNNVTGTSGDSISVSPLTSYGKRVDVSSISTGDISHTFTVSNGLNVPIPPSSNVEFNTTFTTPGVYSWGCMCQCGLFSMSTQGWMYGTIIVS